MKILDIDMDYFMDDVAEHISDSTNSRLSENEFGVGVWTEQRVQDYFEENLGLSKITKVKGRIVSGHNEALIFWKELIESGELKVPFDIIHVDSHSDLGNGCHSKPYILNKLLQYPVSERPLHNKHEDYNEILQEEGIGDYLLFAIAYRWISKLTYCANPNGNMKDYPLEILKEFKENYNDIEIFENTIQLAYNPNSRLPDLGNDVAIEEYLSSSIKEPEIPLITIPTIEHVKFDGTFDFVVLAQSPNYTPASADFIMDIFKEYIIEC